MADTRTKEQRSRIMKSVGASDTGPELTVRRLLHRIGYRFRLHCRDLPGRPDIVFPGRKKAIFVHGCFWHGHDCGKGKLPKSRTEYWTAKIETNQDRDASAAARLDATGWQTLTIWQCELKSLEATGRVLREFLGPPGRGSNYLAPLLVGHRNRPNGGRPHCASSGARPRKRKRAP